MDGRRLLLPISLLTSQLIAYNLKEIRAFHTNPPNFPQTEQATFEMIPVLSTKTIYSNLDVSRKKRNQFKMLKCYVTEPRWKHDVRCFIFKLYLSVAYSYTRVWRIVTLHVHIITWDEAQHTILKQNIKNRKTEFLGTAGWNLWPMHYFQTKSF